MFAMMGFCLPRSEEEESPGSERRSGGSQHPPVLEGTRRSTSSCRERDGHKYVSASSDEEGKEQQDATTANAADAASSCTRRRRPRRHDITVPSESSSKESERGMSMADDCGGGFVGSVETASTAASTVGGASSFASASTSASSTAGGIGVRIAASSSSSSSACRPLPHLPMRRSERGDEKDDDDDDDSSWPRSLPSFAELTADEAEDRIRSMIRQEGEDDGYRTSDYFSTLERRRTTARRKVKKIAKQQRREGTEEAAETSTSTATTGEEPLPVDVECRTKMISWCYQVVDHCHMSRETVSIAASYLDRYLLAPSGLEALLDRRTFQLSAMTSLYVALKLFEDVNVEPGVMVGLSRGAYVEEEFVEMELDILMALRWKVHPPTAVGFMGHFLNLFPARTSRREGRRRHSHSLHRHRIQDEDEDEDGVSLGRRR
mmetsp:Transcript_49328/g.148536  ORF Transcript_49328/g.148536 Transcript_49328/m.148536 type:complete len:434 (-) Transcript_49328:5-1306(-)